MIEILRGHLNAATTAGKVPVLVSVIKILRGHLRLTEHQELTKHQGLSDRNLTWPLELAIGILATVHFNVSVIAILCGHLNLSPYFDSG